jgi:LacI family transcriptional regulator, galactose operon repressor
MSPRPAKPRGTARLADVADAAGVGTSIVSRVLNSDPTVSIRPETRERILQAARRLNYRPNALGRGLKLARTMTLGLVVNLDYGEVGEIVSGVERRAADADYTTLIADAKAFVERGDTYRRLLFEGRVDGLLIASGLANDELVRELSGKGVPFVLLNRRLAGVEPSVTVDDALGARIGVEHLLRLGHRRIGYIAGPEYADVARRRLKGVRGALRDAGLRLSEGQLVHGALAEDAGYDAMQRLLGARRPPTAVAIWSPTAAFGALAAAKQHGLRVPENISVVAFQALPVAAFFDPPLTTVRMPLREMADRGVEILLRLVDGDGAKSIVVHSPPELVVRGSTGPSAA